MGKFILLKTFFKYRNLNFSLRSVLSNRFLPRLHRLVHYFVSVAAKLALILTNNIFNISEILVKENKSL